MHKAAGVLQHLLNLGRHLLQAEGVNAGGGGRVRVWWGFL